MKRVAITWRCQRSYKPLYQEAGLRPVIKIKDVSQVQWHWPVSPELGRQREGSCCRFEMSPIYTATLCLNKQTNKHFYQQQSACSHWTLFITFYESVIISIWRALCSGNVAELLSACLVCTNSWVGSPALHRTRHNGTYLWYQHWGGGGKIIRSSKSSRAL